MKAQRTPVQSGINPGRYSAALVNSLLPPFTHTLAPFILSHHHVQGHARTIHAHRRRVRHRVLGDRQGILRGGDPVSPTDPSCQRQGYFPDGPTSSGTRATSSGSVKSARTVSVLFLSRPYPLGFLSLYPPRRLCRTVFEMQTGRSIVHSDSVLMRLVRP